MVKRSDSLALDTNVVIDILNGRQEIIDKYLPYTQIYLPFIVCGELLFGAHNSAKSKQNLKKFNSFIESCNILNSNYLVTEQYAVTRKALKDKGKPIPENDIWIAATCIIHNVPLATFDKHFQHIPDLTLL